MQSQGFLPIQTLDIEAESQITFDIYMHLPLNQKYILYRKKGGQIESSRFTKIVDGSVNNFFIRPDDYKAFVKYVASRLRALIGVEGTEQQVRMMASTARALLGSTLDQKDAAMVKVLMENLNDITGVIIESVLENSQIGSKLSYQKIVELANKGTDFHKHPVNVSSLAVLLALGIGYNTDRILSEVAMAALLHDVGLAQLPTHIITRSHQPLELSIADRKLLYDHPLHSIEVLKTRRVKLSPMIETMILQHHEQYNGGGYPRGLRGFQINEFSQLLFVADEMDQIIAGPIDTKIELKYKISALLDQYQRELTIDPLLLSRIRSVIL